MSGNTLHYFSGGNTARGFFSLYAPTIALLEKIIILRGGRGHVKSTLMNNVAKTIIKNGVDAELIHCSLSPDFIDGVIFPELKVGIFNGSDPHFIEPQENCITEVYVNIGDAWDSQQLSTKRDEIIHFMKARKLAHENAYQAYAKALTIHGEWELIFNGNTDTQKLHALAEKLITHFFNELSLDKPSNVQHRFLGSATSRGAVDFVPNLTENIQKRYFIKGRPGFGKSILFKKLVQTAENNGFDIEIYHCGLDPNSLDMLIFRELSIAIFDSEAPHEYFPTRENDEIIDLYKETILPDTDKIFAEQIQHIAGRYLEKMVEGNNHLAAAKKAHDALEHIYYETVDYTKIAEVQKEIEDKILQLIQVLDITD